MRLFVAMPCYAIIALSAMRPADAQTNGSRICNGKAMPAIPAEVYRLAREGGHKGEPGYYRCEGDVWVYTNLIGNPVLALVAARSMAKERASPAPQKNES